MSGRRAALDATSTPEPRAEPTPPRTSRISPQLRFVAAAFIALSLFVGTYLLMVATEAGQRIENLALRGAELRDVADRQSAENVLSLVTLALFVLAVTGVFLAGLVLRRPGLGSVAAAVMVLAVAAAELVKEFVGRPVFGPGPVWILRPSFPSGTATAATSMAVGLLLVTPNRLRWLLLPMGALFAAIVGHAVQASGWHRLSDTVGATTLVIGIASLGVAAMARAGLVQRSDGGLIDRRVSRLLLVGSAGMLVVAITMLALPTAFPLLASPDGARRAFLQTALPLVGASLTIFFVTVFGLLIEPFALGSGSGESGRREWRFHRQRAAAEPVVAANRAASAPANDASTATDHPPRPENGASS